MIALAQWVIATIDWNAVERVDVCDATSVTIAAIREAFVRGHRAPPIA